VRGEGDQTMPELAEVLDGRRDPETVLGLSFRRGGETVHTPDRPFIEDLDALPSPDFSLMEGWSQKRVTPLSTSRGCPFGCRFCSVIPMFGTRYRFHSVERVLSDLEQYGPNTKHVFFCDDNFAANRRRAKEICQGIIDRGLNIEWSAQVRADAAQDPELVRLMVESGCWCVFIGLESINPKTLEAYNKHQTVDDIRQSVAVFREQGIRIHGMFVVGADQDDRNTVRETVRFARDLGIETIQFLVLTPTPGTPYFDEMVEAGRVLTRDWSIYDGHHVVHQPALFTPAELQYEVVRATARFYNLRNALSSLLRRDFFDFALKLYAWRAARQFRRIARPFLQELRTSLLRHAQTVRQMIPKGPVDRVVLPTLGLPEQHRRFLQEFLRGLHLKAVEVPVAVARYEEHWAALRNKASVVLLPLIEEGQEKIQGLQRAGALWAAKFENQAVLAVPLTPEHVYRACVELGTVLHKRRRAVRKAYQMALQAAPLV
jgi:radical SAM superfamily enzyme YgiQ (UPF0313 family)